MMHRCGFQHLYEDDTQRRLEESWTVFENICNNPNFSKTVMVLFLNKIDLLQEKLKHRKFSDYYKEYKGPNEFDPVCNWIRERFVALNKTPKTIYAHLTCATDTKNVHRVLEAVKTAILERNVDELSLM